MCSGKDVIPGTRSFENLIFLNFGAVVVKKQVKSSQKKSGKNGKVEDFDPKLMQMQAKEDISRSLSPERDEIPLLLAPHLRRMLRPKAPVHPSVRKIFKEAGKRQRTVSECGSPPAVLRKVYVPRLCLQAHAGNDVPQNVMSDVSPKPGFL